MTTPARMYLDAALALADLAAATLDDRPAPRTTLPALLPCPPWCLQSAGHPWEAVESDGIRLRFHHGTEAPVTGWSLSVLDTADEFGHVTRGPVEVYDKGDRRDVDALQVARRELDALLASV